MAGDITPEQSHDRRFLAGVRVIDFGNNIAGPCVTTILGGLGAEVIKIERPPLGDASRIAPPFTGRSGVTYQRAAAQEEDQVALGFIKRNRGKYSVTMDLNEEDDRQRFIDLVATADVMVENGLPGALAKLGVGYDNLKARNPGLILCSITGFGQTGPCRGWAAYDAIVQSHTGLFVDVANPDAASGVAVADMAGALYGVISILAALVSRSNGGAGAWLDVSMLEATLAFTWESNRDVVQRQKMAGQPVRRVAPWNRYPAADGEVMICAYTDRQWKSLRDHLGIPGEHFDDRLARLDHVDALDALIGEWTCSRSKWDIAFKLQELGVPASPILEPLEVTQSPQVIAREALKPAHHPRFGDIAVATPEFPLHVAEEGHVTYNPATPDLGEHNDLLPAFLARGERRVPRAVEASP
jgi:crotonobetainyl-CoA:carnitine CoA-transferase CaiB-like acyl-CoA transferase